MIWNNDKKRDGHSENIKRVVKKFAWLPTRVDEPENNTVWLSSYYLTQEQFKIWVSPGVSRKHWYDIRKTAWHPNDWLKIIDNSKPRGWIGFDLDGTLALHERGSKDLGYIGPPIEKAIKRVRKYILRGWGVRIVTARAADATPEQLQKIKDWSYVHIGTVLPIVSNKDGHMIVLFDDRAIGVESNTGKILNEFDND